MRRLQQRLQRDGLSTIIVQGMMIVTAGYTHYWHPAKATPQQYTLFFKEAAKILNTPRIKKLLAGPAGDGAPIITPSKISFNGKDDDGHETFQVEKGDTSGEFCKTAEKPYDVAVVMMLALMNDIFGWKVSSDGGASAIRRGGVMAARILGRKLGDQVVAHSSRVTAASMPKDILSLHDAGEKGGMDRFTVVLDPKHGWEKNPNGDYQMIGMAEGGRGISQFTSGMRGRHLGKKIQWKDLSADTQNHIINRLK